jgi:glutamate-ammonia-ligase adenylyltransferase
MVRARPVAGDADVGRRFMDLLEPHLWEGGLTDGERTEIRRIKARVETERIQGDDPEFHLKLGKGGLADVEFCVQLLQLEHSLPATGTADALARLHDTGVLDHDELAALAEAHTWCEQTRNRLFLVRSAPGDSLPVRAEELARLARSLGASAADLRDDYRRVTRRARRVVERRFYGVADRAG